MTFAILGASGHTGIMATRYCLRCGHNARILVRDPNRMPALAEARNGGLEIITGDATDPRAIAELIKNSDAVISALGPSDLRTGYKVHSQAALHLSLLMPEEKISRYVAVSGASLSVPTDKFSVRGKFFSGVAHLFTKTSTHLRRLLDDKRGEYEILTRGPLDWTIVRPPWIVPGDYERDANITPFKLAGSKVRVTELAKALVDLAIDGRFKKQAVFVNSV
ncbi:MAG: NAD(P)H-binding protein [Candidatus Mycalebacterium zealandia]|nr:MAG: NAD(P)H-binding protein [Candidatus Mycalebacterium zealandia]